MKKQTALFKILNFFLVKIIIGIAVVGGCVFLMEWLRQILPDQTQLTNDLKNIITAIADALAALISYIFLFKLYEKRKIKELSASSFIKNAIIGFITGLSLQSLFIFVIYVCATYFIIHINPLSFLLPSLAASLTAGFVAEILIVGIFFRIAEQTLGTVITLIIFLLLFALMHINVANATAISIAATAIQAGILLPAVYIFSRSLWMPIFLHFAWDFSEPGIFGGINPGISINETLFTSKISGSFLITGDGTGPQNSVQSLLLCSIVAVIFLWFAKRKNNFIKPSWKK